MSNQDFHTVAVEILQTGSLKELFSDSDYEYTYRHGSLSSGPVAMDIKIYAKAVEGPVARLELLNGTNEILVTQMPTREEIGLKELGTVSRLMGVLTEKLIKKVRGVSGLLMCEGLGLHIHEDTDGEGDYLSLTSEVEECFTVKLCDSGVEINSRRVQWAMRAILNLIKKEDDLLDKQTRDDDTLGEKNNSFWEGLRDWDFKDLEIKLMDASLHQRISVEVNGWEGIHLLNEFQNEISSIRLPPVQWNPHTAVLTIDDYFKAVKKDHIVIGKV